MSRAYQGTHVSLSAHPIQKRMMFFTEYHFNPRGVRRVIAIFNRTFNADGMEAQVDWIGASQAFRVICLSPKAAEISSRFLAYLADLIKKQLPKPDPEDEDENVEEEYAGAIETFFDPEERLESKYIQRLEVYKQDLSLQTTSALLQPDPSIATTVPFSSVLIDGLKFNGSWVYEKDSLSLDAMLPMNMLGELTQLTGCHFVILYDEGRIIVGGNFQQDVDSALLKLDNIRINHSTSGCFVNHLLYGEDEENVKFILKRFRHISKQLFKSTILDNLSSHTNAGMCDYKTLIDAVRIRCAPYNLRKSLYIPIPDKNVTRSIEVRRRGLTAWNGWTGYIYSARRADDPRPTIAHFPDGLHSNAPPLNTGPGLPVINEKKIEQNAKIVLWANNVSLPNQSVASEINENPLQVVGHHSNQIASDNDAGWDTHNDWAKREPDVVAPSGPKVSKILKANLETFKPDLSTNTPAPRPVAKAVAKPFVKPAAKPVMHQPLPTRAKVASPEKLVPAQKPSVMASILEIEDEELAPHRRSGKLMSALQARPAGQTTTTTPAAPVQTVSAPYQTTSAQVQPTSIPVLPTSTPVQVTSTPAQFSLLDDDILESLSNIPLLRPKNVIQEQVQSFAEAVTRDFKDTMGQRAGKPKTPAPFAGRLETPEWPSALPKKRLQEENNPAKDPHPELVADINQTFTNMVTPLNTFRGQLQIQINFGRIILQRLNLKQLSDNENSKVHEAATIRKMLLNPTAYGPTSNFTKVLTTKAGDISYLLQMKPGSGALLWYRNVASWDVFYDFTFLDKLTNTRFVIEIDGENFATQVKIKQDLGAIFIHGTQRYHDIQISATGYELDKAGKSYAKISQALQNSLWIPSQNTEPELQWVLSRELLNRFFLEDLTVRRISRFNNIDQASSSMLAISDMCSLEVAGARLESQDYCVFYGTPGPADCKPHVKLNTWQEAAIISTRINDLVAANEKLELGDRAGWTQVDMNDTVMDMCSPAFEMLKQMDGVGWEDENGVQIAAQSSTSEYTSEYTSAPKYNKHGREKKLW